MNAGGYVDLPKFKLIIFGWYIYFLKFSIGKIFLYNICVAKQKLILRFTTI